MAALIEIDKRNAARATIIAECRKLRVPPITDGDSLKEFTKILKDHQSDLMDKCFLVTEDYAVLRRALVLACEKAKLEPDRMVEASWQEQRLDEETTAILNKRRNEEAIAREKEHVKNGKIPDVPGQMKFDDALMPSAEAASPVTVRKIDPVE